MAGEAGGAVVDPGATLGASQNTKEEGTTPVQKRTRKPQLEDAFDGAYWAMPTTPRRALFNVDEELMSSVLEEEDEESREIMLRTGKAVNSYLHSEAARLAERNKDAVEGVPVPDVATGEVLLDGVYWNLTGDTRTRRARQLQFFPESHVVGATGAPSAPRAPLSPESEARRKERQRIATEQRRAEREVQQAQDRAEFVELVEFLSHGRQIAPGLYIGGQLVAENDRWLDSSIDFVVNIAGMRFPYMERFGNDRVLAIELADNPHADAKSLFASVVERVSAQLSSGKRVLVHCKQGKSRSAAFIAAYLVAKGNMSLRAALDLITTTNRGHKINDGFLRQLMSWECQCTGLSSSTIHDSFHSRQRGAVDNEEVVEAEQ